MNGRLRDRAGFTLIELLVVIAIISVLIALLLPAVQSAREAARRSQCVNNLMQVGLALKNYEAAHEVLPPGVVNPTGPIKNLPPGYHVGWMVQILPYIEQKNIFNHLNFDRGAYDPANTTTRSMTITSFLCPSDAGIGGGDVAQNNYAACHHDVEAPIAADNTGAFFLNSAVRYEDIEDGSSNTIFLGEKTIGGVGLGWASGTKATLRNAGTPINAPIFATATVPDPVGGFGSPHPGGANFSFGDGSVKFIKGSIGTRVYRLLANRADGDMISASEF